MAIRARIELKDESGKRTSRSIGVMQSITIGSSTASDICVYDDTDVHSKHCEISVTKTGCSIRDLTKGRGVLSVNGAATLESQLRNEDLIQVGYNEVKILLTGQPDEADGGQGVANVSTGNLTGQTENAAAEKPELHVMDNGLSVLEIPHSNDIQKLFLEKFANAGNFYLAVNFRIAGENPEDHELDDLLTQSPAEVRESNSLSLIGPSPFAEAEKQFFDLKEKDCAILLSAVDNEMPMDRFKEEAVTLFSWLLRPSKFDFHMRNGIKFLLEKVFSLVDMAVFYLPESKKWIVIAMDSSVEAFEQLRPK